MRYFLFIGLSLGLLSCKTEETETPVTTEKTNVEISESTNPVTDKVDLVVVEGNVFTEYYPGKKDIKFQGTQDEEGRRHGKWLFFSEEGEELSMTMYMNGKKHGHSIVKYPNGGIRYTGEYIDDQPVGIWKTYATNGEMTNKKDYGYPQN